MELKGLVSIEPTQCSFLTYRSVRPPVEPMSSIVAGAPETAHCGLSLEAAARNELSAARVVREPDVGPRPQGNGTPPTGVSFMSKAPIGG